MMSPEAKQEILAVLERTYRGTGTALKYSTPFEFLVAVILSAQCTDKRVNQVTSRLFPAYNTSEKMLTLSQEKLEDLIRDCGLFRTKARNILAASEIILRDFGGRVPCRREDLLRLPGVGHKTANVVLSQLCGIPALAVDTHVFRVARRLGLADGRTPDEVGAAIEQIVPREKWGSAHHWLIWHGRLVCRAKKPPCETCPLGYLCPSRKGLAELE